MIEIHTDKFEGEVGPGWGTTDNIWGNFVGRVTKERERYRMGTGLDFVDHYGVGAKESLRDVNEHIRSNSKGSWMWPEDQITARYDPGPLEWKPQGKLYVSSGQMPRIAERDEYMIATGRRRRRISPGWCLSIIEDRLGWSPEARVVFKTWVAVLKRCEEKRIELSDAVGRGSGKAYTEGIEKVTSMQLMVYRCLNKVLDFSEGGVLDENLRGRASE